jgi:cold shock CspA family protein/ribosomal protein S18 acetylase RimI-like enzyme
VSALFAEYEPDAHGAAVPVVVEPLAPHHLAEVVALAVQREGGDPAAWLASLEGSLDSAERATFVGMVGGRVAGYATVGWLAPGTGDPSSPAPAAWYLLGLVVAPPFRRQGVGRQLTAARLHWLHERGTDQAWYFVSSLNQASLDLHEEFGFRQTATDLRLPGVAFTGKGLLYVADVGGPFRLATVYESVGWSAVAENLPAAVVPESVGPVPGRVKFWKSDKGWGAISSETLPPGRDAFAHFSVIEADGYRELAQGQAVEFRYRATRQDRFEFIAEWVRAID